MNSPASALTDLSEGAQKILPVVLVTKNWFPRSPRSKR